MAQKQKETFLDWTDEGSLTKIWLTAFFKCSMALSTFPSPVLRAKKSSWLNSCAVLSLIMNGSLEGTLEQVTTYRLVLFDTDCFQTIYYMLSTLMRTSLSLCLACTWIYQRQRNKYLYKLKYDMVFLSDVKHILLKTLFTLVESSSVYSKWNCENNTFD